MRIRTKEMAAALIIACALILAVALPVAADDAAIRLRTEDVSIASAPIIAEPAPARYAMAALKMASLPQPTENNNITLDFHAADISDVLKALSVQTGTNIVTGTDVKGQVTVSLNKVSLREALDLVTKLSGYRYASASPNTYVVGSAQALSAVLSPGSGDTTVVEAVTLHFASAKELAEALKGMFPGLQVSIQGQRSVQQVEQETAAYDRDGEDSLDAQDLAPAAKTTRSIVKSGQEGQAILLKGSPVDIESAKDVIRTVEEALAQTDIATRGTKIYSLKYATAKDVQATLAKVVPELTVTAGPSTAYAGKAPTISSVSGRTTAGGSASAPSQAEAEQQTLILTGSASDLQRAMELIAEVDVKPVQILIEAKIVDVKNNAAKDLGVQWDWDPFSSTGLLTAENTKDRIGYGPHTPSRTVTRNTTIAAGVTATLNLMINSGKGKLLANPRIAAIAGKPANIFIGDEITYIINKEQTPQGQNIQTATAQVGIELRAIGTVGEGDDITLNLHPEVSVISDYLDAGNGIKIPQISRRFADTTMRVKDGETIVIGGLIRDQEIESMSKIPLLGDLPVLGHLFRNKSKSKDNSEITIFLTATVIKEA